MSQTVLAQGVVEFLAKGQEKVAAGQNAVQKGLERFAKKASPFTTLNFVLGGIDSAITALGRFATILAAGIGGWVTASVKGTLEGQRLANAFTFLGRIMGDMLAPYIRALTANIVQLGRMIANVDAATRYYVTGIVLVTGALATLTVVATRVYAALSPLLGLAGSLLAAFLKLGVGILAAMGPWGIAIAVIGALGAAIALLFNPFESWEEANDALADGLSTAWAKIQVGWRALMVGFQTAWDQYGMPTLMALGAVWNWAYSILAPIISGLTDLVLNFFGSANEGGTTFGAIVATIYEGFADTWTAVAGISSAIFTELIPAFREIGNIAVWLYKSVLTPVFNGIAAIWKWLTSFISFTWKDAMKFLSDTILGVVIIMGQILNGLYSIISKVVSAIINSLAWLGEKTSILSKATADEMREYSKTLTDGQAVDVEKLTKEMGKASLSIGTGLDQNKEAAKGIAKAIDEEMGKIKPPPIPGLGGGKLPKPEIPKLPKPEIPKLPKFNLEEFAMGLGIPKFEKGKDQFKGMTPGGGTSSLEATGGTFDRLLTAFATNPGQDIATSTLNEIRSGNKIQEQIAANTGRFMPAVGP